jgi:hypothetical protein
MKHIFEDDSDQFHTSKDNYFELHDIDRTIWRFYQNNEKTSFHIRGNPYEVFIYENIRILDHLSCCLAALEKKLLDADGLFSLISDECYALDVQIGLTNLSRSYAPFIALLDKYSATISEEKIHQYIKANEL